MKLLNLSKLSFLKVFLPFLGLRFDYFLRLYRETSIKDCISVVLFEKVIENGKLLNNPVSLLVSQSTTINFLTDNLKEAGVFHSDMKVSYFAKEELIKNQDINISELFDEYGDMDDYALYLSFSTKEEDDDERQIPVSSNIDLKPQEFEFTFKKLSLGKNISQSTSNLLICFVEERQSELQKVLERNGGCEDEFAKGGLLGFD